MIHCLSASSRSCALCANQTILNRITPGVQVARHHAAITAVIPWPAQDQNSRMVGYPTGQLGQPGGRASAGVFHQDQGRQPQVSSRLNVKLPDLLAR